MTVYTSDFYNRHSVGSMESAEEVIPVVLELTGGGLTSILDVGCGIGEWLACLAEQHPVEVVGVDGEYVEREKLLIPFSDFVAHDLTTPLNLGRRFDLVMSLEVAEHLDCRYATTFVESLCEHADETVLFSAAVPGQGGEHHVNEQWPSFWIQLFSRQGFTGFDVIRPRIWTNHRVESWYRQNMFLFARGSMAERLGREASGMIDVIHPEEMARMLERQSPREQLWRRLPSPVRSALSKGKTIVGGRNGDATAAPGRGLALARILDSRRANRDGDR